MLNNILSNPIVCFLTYLCCFSWRKDKNNTIFLQKNDFNRILMYLDSINRFK